MPVFNSYKILFLPKWYPNRVNKFNGIFVERHAQAISQKCNTAVLYVGADPNLKAKFEIENTAQEKLKVICVYYRNNDLGNSVFGKSIKLFRYLKAAYLGLKLIKAEFGKPNLVHVNVLTRPGIVALLLKKINHIPYIITEHWSGYMPADGAYKGSLKKFFTQLVVKNAEQLTTVSKQLATCMQQAGLTGKYVTIENCIDVPPSLKKTIPSIPKAIFIGNLENREKNISPILEAIAALKNEIPELQLTIIGDGVDKNLLQEQTAQLGLSQQITFTGALDHAKVLEQLSNAAFLILNSNYETFSVVTAEALACGTPVITTRCGGPEEFVTAECGKTISVNNASELKEALEWMCRNFAGFNSEKIKNTYATKFNAETIAAKFISVYNPLISSWEAGNTRELIRIPFSWKVLDVGSGDHPNERADVLLEREIEETEHRSGAKAVIPEGKKLVLGDATEMPFSNKEFDFVIASHIAEHIDEPEKFCAELQRVAKAGYLETPDAFSEFIFNEPFHKWVVSNKNGVLVFTEKVKFKVFSERFYRFYYLNEKRTNHEAMYSNNRIVITFVNLIRKSWKHLPRTYTRFHWKENFEFKVIRKS